MPVSAPPVTNQILSLSVSGGRFDGAELSFASGLNCLIGGYGTGKTTLIEFIRFALDLVPEDPDSRARFQELLRANLAGGSVTLHVLTDDGVHYKIIRALDHAHPLVFDAQDQPSDIVKPALICPIDLMSQNEIERVARQIASQRQLIDRFAQDDLDAIARRIKETQRALAQNGTDLEPLLAEIEGLEDLRQEAEVTHNALKTVKKGPAADNDEVNAGHDEKSARARESEYAEGIEELTVKLSDALEKMLKQLALRRSEASEHCPDPTEANAAHIDALRQRQIAMLDKVSDLLSDAVTEIAAGQTDIRRQTVQLRKDHTKQEAAFQELLSKHKEAQKQAEQRTKLQEKRDHLNKSIKGAERASTKRDALLEQRAALRQQLEDLQAERHAIRQGIVDRLNPQVKPGIVLAVDQQEDREDYKRCLTRHLAGKGLQQNVTAAQIADSIGPQELANILERGDRSAFDKATGLPGQRAAKAFGALSPTRVRHEIDTMVHDDLPHIRFVHDGVTKELAELSPGQKCTTILPLLLLERTVPLLIDQPEDNLDNRYISDTICTKLSDAKTRRQLVIVTHNPNIPVLGEAEQVAVITGDGNSSAIPLTGTVNERKPEILRLLEGGDAAFRLRSQRYGDLVT